MLEVLPFVEDPDLSGSAAPALPQLLPPWSQNLMLTTWPNHQTPKNTMILWPNSNIGGRRVFSLMGTLLVCFLRAFLNLALVIIFEIKILSVHYNFVLWNLHYLVIFIDITEVANLVVKHQWKPEIFCQKGKKSVFIYISNITFIPLLSEHINYTFPGDSVQTDWDNSDHLRLSLLIFHSA